MTPTDRIFYYIKYPVICLVAVIYVLVTGLMVGNILGVWQ